MVTTKWRAAAAIALAACGGGAASTASDPVATLALDAGASDAGGDAAGASDGLAPDDAPGTGDVIDPADSAPPDSAGTDSGPPPDAAPTDSATAPDTGPWTGACASCTSSGAVGCGADQCAFVCPASCSAPPPSLYAGSHCFDGLQPGGTLLWCCSNSVPCSPPP